MTIKLVPCFLMKSRKRSSRDILGTFFFFLPHTPALFMTSLTQTAGHKNNDSTRGRVFTTFRRRFFTNRTRYRVKNCRGSLSLSLSLSLSFSLSFLVPFLSVESVTLVTESYHCGHPLRYDQAPSLSPQHPRISVLDNLVGTCLLIPCPQDVMDDKMSPTCP